MDPRLWLSHPASPTTTEELALLTPMPYCSLVGSLVYLAVGTRLDIDYAIYQLCRYLDCYLTVHWEGVKCVVQYLKGTHDLALTLGGDHPARLLSHTDYNFAVCVDTCCSVSSFCFSLGLSVVTWCSRQQCLPSLSSCEAEFITASKATQEVLWLCLLLAAIGFPQLTTTPLLYNNWSAITLTEDHIFDLHMHHVEKKYLHIQHHVHFSHFKLVDIHSSFNLADIFTKALPRSSFINLCDCLGLSTSSISGES